MTRLVTADELEKLDEQGVSYIIIVTNIKDGRPVSYIIAEI